MYDDYPEDHMPPAGSRLGVELARQRLRTCRSREYVHVRLEGNLRCECGRQEV